MDKEKQLDAVRGLKRRVPPMTYKKLMAVVLEKPPVRPRPKLIYSAETISAFNKILEIVGGACGIEPTMITMRTRVWPIVDARTITIYHSKEIFNSLAEVADQFEGFRHADIIYHLKRYVKLEEVDSRFREIALKINELMKYRNDK